MSDVDRFGYVKNAHELSLNQYQIQWAEEYYEKNKLEIDGDEASSDAGKPISDYKMLYARSGNGK